MRPARPVAKSSDTPTASVEELVDRALAERDAVSAERPNGIGDPRFLPTLPRRQVVSGAAECVKVFAVSSEEVLDAHRETVLACGIDPGNLDPWQAAIWDAARLKLELLAEDPFERSSRRLLNYGHAFAHSFEEISRHALLHGEAVLLGMTIENEGAASWASPAAGSTTCRT
jgi:3-dehydroquinate synthase